MQKIIYKYRLPSLGAFTVNMPSCAKILCAKEQQGGVVLWAEVNSPPEISIDREFYVLPTGGIFEDVPKKYIDTVLLHQGLLVMHVFELLPKAKGATND